MIDGMTLHDRAEVSMPAFEPKQDMVNIHGDQKKLVKTLLTVINVMHEPCNLK